MEEQKYYQFHKLANTYKLLEKRKPPTDQEFVVYARFLFSEPSDGRYGMEIFLGAYPTKRRALEEVNNIIKRTGHDSIYITEACKWEYIDEKKRPDRTIYVEPDTKSEDLENQYREKILKEKDEEEKRELISKELDEQTINELDPNTVDHYAHNWFNAIRNKAEYEYHKREMEKYLSLYQNRIDKIITQYNNDPSVEETWLDIYKNRLTRRGEADIYEMLKMGHDALIDNILKNNKD